MRLPELDHAAKLKSLHRRAIRSHWEELFAQQCQAFGLPPYVREFEFARPRKWRFDFCWKDQGVAVEIEGGTWQMGRHTRGSGFKKDCEKYNAASAVGWRVFRFTSEMVKSGEAVAHMEKFFRGKVK